LWSAVLKQCCAPLAGKALTSHHAPIRCSAIGALMTDTPKADVNVQVLLDEIREHLLKAQELMDVIKPDSVLGARLQQLIDEAEEQMQ
jgi:hypothetical protein